MNSTIEDPQGARERLAERVIDLSSTCEPDPGNAGVGMVLKLTRLPERVAFLFL
jgi:hypothetical protein